jgi:hypothetical protein
VISCVGPGSAGSVWTSSRSARSSNTGLASCASNVIGAVLGDNLIRQGDDSVFGWGAHGSAVLSSRGVVFGTSRGIPGTGADAGDGSLPAGGDVGALGVGFEDNDLGASLVECSDNTIGAGDLSLVHKVGLTRTASPSEASVAVSSARGSTGSNSGRAGLYPRDLGGGRGSGLDVCVLGSKFQGVVTWVRTSARLAAPLAKGTADR